MGLIKGQPQISTYNNPVDVIGEPMMKLLTEHYKKVQEFTGDYDTKATKFWDADTRGKLATAYEALRNHGYYPIRYNGSIKKMCIIWGVLVKSEMQIMYEKYEPFDKPLPTGEMTEEDADRYRQYVHSMSKKIGKV